MAGFDAYPPDPSKPKVGVLGNPAKAGRPGIQPQTPAPASGFMSPRAAAGHQFLASIPGYVSGAINTMAQARSPHFAAQVTPPASSSAPQSAKPLATAAPAATPGTNNTIPGVAPAIAPTANPAPERPAPVRRLGIQAPQPADVARQAIQEQLENARWMSAHVGSNETQIRWGDRALGAARQLQLHDANRAEVASSDQVGLLERIAKASPQAQSLFAITQGVDPGQLGAIQSGGGAVPRAGSNYESILAGEEPLHVKVGQVAANPTPENVQGFRDWFGQQQARDGFNQELNAYSPGDPNRVSYAGTGGYLSNYLQGLRSALHGVTGEPQDEIARNQKFHADLAKLGYAPGPIGISNPVQALYNRVGIRRPNPEP